MKRVALLLAVLVWTVAVPTVVAGTPAALGTTPQAADGTRCSFPYATTDATGTRVTLPAEPQRIVTLNPSAAQTMWEIGAKGKVVGLTRYAGYLAGANRRTNVSGADAVVVVERVVALSPDLVLAPNATPASTVEQLREAGLTVYRFRRAESIADVYDKTRRIGRLVGACDGAAATVARMRERIATAREAAAGKPHPDVLYSFYGYTAGRGTFVDAVIEAAGGNNVAADYGVVGYKPLNPEVVVEANPDWLVRNSHDPTVPEGAPYASTTAVEEGHVVVVPIQDLNQPAPRIADGVTKLVTRFHPGAYAAANASESSTATATGRAHVAGRANVTGRAASTETPTGTVATSASTGTTPNPRTTNRAGTVSREPTATSTVTRGQLGFGIPVALAALAAALLSARRAD